MGRLPGFDYKRPFFYMVTIKRAKDCQLEFGGLSKRGIEKNAVGEAFERVIRRFHEKWYCIEPIRYFVIMPDHLHLIVKMRGDVEKRVSLAVVVRQLMKELTRSASCKTAMQDSLSGCNGGRVLQGSLGASNGRMVLQGSLHEPIFEFEWHDWIVKKEGQLATFRRYIAENPARAWARRENRRFFTTVRSVSFAGREWKAYGNLAILDLPVIEPFKCSRKWAKDGEEWREAIGRAERIGPGGAGAGTFMSPCEKECGNAIYKAGGSLIVLYPEGFNERWHPTRNKEALCAKGRLIFLSLWEASAAKPDNATLYKRCHEMGDLITAHGARLAKPEGGACASAALLPKGGGL